MQDLRFNKTSSAKGNLSGAILILSTQDIQEPLCQQPTTLEILDVKSTGQSTTRFLDATNIYSAVPIVIVNNVVLYSSIALL